MTRDEETIRHTIPVGQRLADALTQMAALAKFTGRSVTASYGRAVLVMDPGATATDTMVELLNEALERMKEGRT